MSSLSTNDWLQAITQHPARENSIRLTASAATVLAPEKQPDECLTSVSQELDGVLLFVSNRTLTLVHHVTNLGNVRSSPEPAPFAIQGFDLISFPVQFTTADMFGTLQTGTGDAQVPLRTPDITTLLSLDTPGLVTDPILPAAITTDFSGRHSFLVPPALIADCVRAQGEPPAVWFLQIRNILEHFSLPIVPPPDAAVPEAQPPAAAEDQAQGAANLDADDEDDDIPPRLDAALLSPDQQFAIDTLTPASKTYYTAFLSFLWLATQNLIPDTPCSPSLKPSYRLKFEELKTSVTPANLHQLPLSQPPVSPPTDFGSILEALRTSLSSTTSATKEKRSFETLPTSVKQSLLLCCSPDGMTVPKSLPQFALDLFKNPNLGEAQSYLGLTLESQFGCNAHINAFITAPLYKGYLMWEQPEAPTHGFSVFHLGKRMPSDSVWSSKAMQLDLKLSSGGHLNDNDTEKIMQRKFFRPSSIHEASQQIVNFGLVARFYLGHESLIFQKLQAWTSHIHMHSSVYDALQHADNEFATKLLFCIDLRVQQVIRSCYHANGDIDNVNFHYIHEFSRIQSDIVTRQFSIIIPPDLRQRALNGQPAHTPRSSSSSSTTTTTTNSRNRKQGSRDTPSAPTPVAKQRGVENPDKTCCLAAGEVFSVIFPRGKVLYSELPNFNGNSACKCCLHWHAKGWCKETGCRYTCSHGSMNIETKKLFLEFMVKQRAHVKSS